MPRTIVDSRQELGFNNLLLVGNSNLNLAISYVDIVSPLSGSSYTSFDPDSDSWTLNLWVYLTHTGISTDYNYSISIFSQTDNNGGFAMVSGAGTGRGFISSNVGTGQFSCNLGNVSRLSGFVPQPNTWYMVTLVRDKVAQTLTFYVNGVAYNSFSGVVSFESCTGKYRIGANRGIVRSMDGYVEKPRLIKGTAYTQIQINNLFLNDTVVGTKEFELTTIPSSGNPTDTGVNSYTITYNNGAAANTNQSFVRFPDRSQVVGNRNQVSDNRAVVS